MSLELPPGVRKIVGPANPEDGMTVYYTEKAAGSRSVYRAEILCGPKPNDYWNGTVVEGFFDWNVEGYSDPENTEAKILQVKSEQATNDRANKAIAKAAGIAVRVCSECELIENCKAPLRSGDKIPEVPINFPGMGN